MTLFHNIFFVTFHFSDYNIAKRMPKVNLEVATRIQHGSRAYCTYLDTSKSIEVDRKRVFQQFNRNVLTQFFLKFSILMAIPGLFSFIFWLSNKHYNFCNKFM